MTPNKRQEVWMNEMSVTPKTEAGTAAKMPWAMSPEDWPGLRAAEAWMQIGSEAWTFWADRIRADVQTERELVHCTNPIDAQVVLMRHVHKMMEDYHREAGRLVEMLHTVPGAAAVLDE
ncbi:hypothetical protein ATO8_09683 [Roseivivax marinus]|uniref:Phasin domain-containing protein n=2 Tax=Roseivivax marinus TaxID=1379903 RepID=W4HJB3_9RHOB|nr:hypothetical protein ATO8_09683 [Roseivivax marinus]